MSSDFFYFLSILYSVVTKVNVYCFFKASLLKAYIVFNFFFSLGRLKLKLYMLKILPTVSIK